jgi:hypothetical protein
MAKVISIRVTSDEERATSVRAKRKDRPLRCCQRSSHIKEVRGQKETLRDKDRVLSCGYMPKVKKKKR